MFIDMSKEDKFMYIIGKLPLHLFVVALEIAVVTIMICFFGQATNTIATDVIPRDTIIPILEFFNQFDYRGEPTPNNPIMKKKWAEGNLTLSNITQHDDL